MTPPPRTPTPTTAAPRGGRRVAKPRRGWQGWLHPILARTRAGKGKEVNACATLATPPPPRHPQENTRAVARSLRTRGNEGAADRGCGNGCNLQRRGAVVTHGKCADLGLFGGRAEHLASARVAVVVACWRLGLVLRLVRSLAVGRSSPPRRSDGAAVALVALAGRGVDRRALDALMRGAQAWAPRSRECSALHLPSVALSGVHVPQPAVSGSPLSGVLPVRTALPSPSLCDRGADCLAWPWRAAA